jgi:hypothetical protein
MAYHDLAIPSMSAACERIFSSAKLLLNDRRSYLKPDIIEANECLRHWYGASTKGAFDPLTNSEISDKDDF